MSLFNRVLVLACVWILATGFIKTPTGLNKKGNRLYEEKKYESALEAYRDAQIRNPDQSEIRYNLGTSLYQLDQFQEAEVELEQALSGAKTKELQAQAWYNYGNIQYRLGQFEKAIEAYKKTLDLNPDDQDAKYNLEVLQKKKSMFEQKQEERDDQRKNQPNQQQQEQQSQGGGQGQEQQQDQQSQGQGDQEESESQQSQAQEGEQEKDQQDPSQQGGQQQDQDEGEEKDSRPFGEQQEEPKDEPKDQAGQQQQQEQQKKEQNQRNQQQQRPLLQGQMAQSDAMRILDALRETEQQLQMLRRPTNPQPEREPLKDW
jgi:Ca-activated chloride channel homolog